MKKYAMINLLFYVFSIEKIYKIVNDKGSVCCRKKCILAKIKKCIFAKIENHTSNKPKISDFVTILLPDTSK